ncbi:MAG: ATP-binding protein [Deltaproteobacteria bacterium]|nr:ATP-binding protein [Deltaproteobacteria bacterium]
MRELSLHILDIMENSVGAGATLIDLAVIEKSRENLLEIRIRDNGRGMSPEMLKEVADPFFTTRTTRRVGLGLSLFQEASRRCEGDFHIQSREGEGTEVTASFRRDHIDLAPMGDMGRSLTSLIMGNPWVDILYTHEVDGRVFSLDTREVKKELEDVPVNHPEVIRYLTEVIRDGIVELKKA